MDELSDIEKTFYRFVIEGKLYEYWYTRFLICGVDLDRIRRVMMRIMDWHEWCSEWSKEGELLENRARDALSQGNTHSAKWLFHEAAGCFHVGQHWFFIDPDQKNRALERVWENYGRAIDLYDEDRRPIRVEVPFRGTVIPGYLRTTDQTKRPLVLFINGMDNIKEVELHYWGSLLLYAGFNTFAFDGPGQGEMWKDMKFIPDYEKAVTEVIDWFEENDRYGIDLRSIATVGFSLGGYLSPRAAAFDERIRCAIGNGGPAHAHHFSDKLIVNPILHQGIPHLVGAKTYEESLEHFDIDIKSAPPMDRPLLIFHSGQDKLIPYPREHADYFMEWAVGEKELKWYPDGEHVCANYLDEVIPYTIDWLHGHLCQQ